jgi:hypothetical protein
MKETIVELHCRRGVPYILATPHVCKSSQGRHIDVKGPHESRHGTIGTVYSGVCRPKWRKRGWVELHAVNLSSLKYGFIVGNEVVERGES